ncbi:MAG TPA: phenylacetic acid degradation protein PaaN [Spongiibacteraceae bacterium]|nr:phenylacetic acid degradation protein PaaN [Spongiibacteraceae bacterium]HCS26258.1 phenylacetic acid degradation protein PaaN [Spongiibacteraceae bacterium]
MPATSAGSIFEKHRQRFEQAQIACRERHHWSAFPELHEHPQKENGQREAQSRFQSMLHQGFALEQPGIRADVGEEESPYTQEALGIRYPQSDIDVLFDAAGQAMDAWALAGIETRTGVLLEVVDRLFQQMFDIATAVMHTAGQSPNMSYTGSGVNALDRAIEALVYAYEAMCWTPQTARWERSFGKAQIALNKRYRIVPRGVAVCFSCASFPTWNAWPSMMASLATGNAVIVKPHPGSVLPMALSVTIFRDVLAEFGFDPNLVTLALDTHANPIGKQLVKHPKTAIVDFTGSVEFGSWVEANAHPALCYTETAGVNTVVLDSCDDLDAVLRSLATTLCMFSAQMCTSPQNIYLPAEGVKEGRGEAMRLIPAAEVKRRLAAAVDNLIQDPRKAAMILACVQAPQTLTLLRELESLGEVLLQPQAYPHPDYPNARTSTPLMLGVTPAQRALYLGERFGPVSFVIECASADDALMQATQDVREAGGLTAFVYSRDEDFLERAEQGYARAGAQLTCNLTGPMPLNFAAAYSDFHVTGLNPAGNASLTELGFVAQRFRITQSRRPA